MDKSSIYYVCSHYLMGDKKCLRASHDLREVCGWKEEFKNDYQYQELYICNEDDELFYEFDGREIKIK